MSILSCGSLQNGNITDLHRKGLVHDNNTMDVIDDLKYQYPSYSNRLETVHDMSDRDEGFKDGLNAINNINDYVYDTNGNMISDQNKEISLITYNHLNLPERIEMTQGVIEYFYDATGVKQKKRVTYPNNDFSETLYAGGFVCSQTQATTLLHDFDFYFTPEGYAKKENGLLSYVYQYKDHLGNIRLSYQKGGNGNAEIIEENNYYPFGLKHDGYNLISSSDAAEKYKYNGKEYQDELGLEMYDYGARNYDPAIGRWMNIDPLANKLQDISPYNYVLNNPLSFIDPDGEYPKPVLIYNQTTNTYRFTNAASHLLSLVSGVDKRKIQNTTVLPRALGQYRPWYSSNNGGGAMTLGWPDFHTITYTENYFEDDATKYEGNGYDQDIYQWLYLSSHEVGHLDQIDREGGFFSYVGEFISQYASAGNHNDAKYENEADIGQGFFYDFNRFLNGKYGINSLTNLFKNHVDPVIVKTLDKWWGEFEVFRGKKEVRTQSFVQGLSTNLENYTEGTYIYNGTNWVLKN